MKKRTNVSLAELTSLACGGPAETLIDIEDQSEVTPVLEAVDNNRPLWVLGHGKNSLISDDGLPGTTLRFFGHTPPEFDENLAIVDAGVLWDSFVQNCIAHNLWGLELTSGIPGGVGAAVVINITAYGQRVSETLEWADVLDPASGIINRMAVSEMGYGYKSSKLLVSGSKLIVLRAAFKLSSTPTKELEYTSALRVASELGLKPDSLQSRRAIIMETRHRAGSLYDENGPDRERTAGSFFKNPLVSAEKAAELAEFEEAAISKEQLLEQNRIHGGEARRVSSAHILLAAGFKRGQSWGAVRLHPHHVLKIENTGGAKAQEVYDVAQEIMATVKTRLDIDLEPEVQFLGEFK
jgi:UDP-N-acetylmuramate dehydrogenase